jgi:hypothetical protein
MNSRLCAGVFLLSAAYAQSGEQPHYNYVMPSLLNKIALDMRFEVAQQQKVPHLHVLLFVKKVPIPQKEVCRGLTFRELGAESEADITIAVTYPLPQ